MADDKMAQPAINTIRTLSMDAVQAAKSGHPGTPMALAPLVYTIWNRVMRFAPQDPRCRAASQSDRTCRRRASLDLRLGTLHRRERSGRRDAHVRRLSTAQGTPEEVRVRTRCGPHRCKGVVEKRNRSSLPLRARASARGSWLSYSLGRPLLNNAGRINAAGLEASMVFLAQMKSWSSESASLATESIITRAAHARCWSLRSLQQSRINTAAAYAGPAAAILQSIVREASRLPMRAW